VIGFEALARWTHSALGSIPPDVFVAVAERTGQIRELGLQVLETAHAAACDLATSAGHAIDMSINISAAQVTDPRLAERVHELAVRRPDVRLVLELTEGSQLHDDLATLQALHRFKGYGAELALDDFGMGYSSVGYLDRLPFDVIKIDRSFVMRLDDPSTQALVTGIIAMARALDLTVVAEGIEDWGRGALLRDMGCPLGQGYFFARPMDLADAMAFAARGAVDLASVPTQFRA
jgi:EAL domain-containing protein (putative c-di-GMP-specific phosphodiesterase class I)